MKNVKIFSVLAALAAFVCVEAQDLGGMLGGATGNASRSRQRDNEMPTEITAMTMEIDAANNIATLTGEVVVDDQEMTLSCDKMLIILEDKAKDSVKSVNAADAENGVDDVAGNKQLKRVDCIGNVVITRKQIDESTPDKKAEESKKAQQAFAGKAVYDFVNGTIVLTEKPLVHMGSNTASGDKITIFVNEEYRSTIEGHARISARGLSRDGVAPQEKKDVKKEAGKNE